VQTDARSPEMIVRLCLAPQVTWMFTYPNEKGVHENDR
jgi:hypothetical protein